MNENVPVASSESTLVASPAQAHRGTVEDSGFRVNNRTTVLNLVGASLDILVDCLVVGGFHSPTEEGLWLTNRTEIIP